jgi:hypothetical protein
MLAVPGRLAGAGFISAVLVAGALGPGPVPAAVSEGAVGRLLIGRARLARCDVPLTGVARLGVYVPVVVSLLRIGRAASFLVGLLVTLVLVGLLLVGLLLVTLLLVALVHLVTVLRPRVTARTLRTLGTRERLASPAALIPLEALALGALLGGVLVAAVSLL